MKALLCSIGTRGDVEPFLAIAQILKEHNWEVVCLFPEQFRDTVEAMDLRFEGFTEEFLNLLEGEQAKMVMGSQGTWWQRFKALLYMSKEGMRLQKVMVALQHRLQIEERPDRVLYHPKCLMSVVWGLANPGKSIMISPLPCITHPVRELTTIGIRGNGNYGQSINLFTYWFTNWMKAFMTYATAKRFIKDFPNLKLTRRKIFNAIIKTERSLYTISSHLFPQPDYWPKHVEVVGYYERDKTANWSPSSALKDFIEQHKKIVFVSFGSMSNANPKEKTQIIVDTLAKHNIPAIVNTSWGGLEKPTSHPDHILFVENIPYDWIFSKVYAVIHHGGSGTTHAGLKYGCATMIIPHIVDQYYWNNNVSGLGLGPKGMFIKKMTSSNFENKLLNLLNNSSYKKKAELISGKMKSESDPERIYQIISR